MAKESQNLVKRASAKMLGSMSFQILDNFLPSGRSTPWHGAQW